MGELEIVQVPQLKDNYAYVLHCREEGVACVVDCSEPPAVLAVVRDLGARLVALWATHHHWDHIGGHAELVAGDAASLDTPKDAPAPASSRAVPDAPASASSRAVPTGPPPLSGSPSDPAKSLSDPAKSLSDLGKSLSYDAPDTRSLPGALASSAKVEAAASPAGSSFAGGGGAVDLPPCGWNWGLAPCACIEAGTC